MLHPSVTSNLLAGTSFYWTMQNDVKAKENGCFDPRQLVDQTHVVAEKKRSIT